MWNTLKNVIKKLRKTTSSQQNAQENPNHKYRLIGSVCAGLVLGIYHGVYLSPLYYEQFKSKLPDLGLNRG